MNAVPQIRHSSEYFSLPITPTFRQVLTRMGCLLLFAAMLVCASISRAQTVSADFGGRTTSTPVVPTGIFAVNGVGSTLSDTGQINTLARAGLNGTRIWIEIDQVYATSTPNYSYVDRFLTTIQTAGLHPIAVINGTPPSLGASPCSAPSNVSQWAQMAAALVAHIDQKFPGVVQDYEIWNEPENPASLCVSDPTAALNTYVSIFQAAAPAMKAQAQADSQTIHIGGPVIADLTQASTWLPALLNNTSTAPYVDFVSFHLYLTGPTDIANGMQWPDLYSITQSSLGGVAYYYNLIESLVLAGTQPNAASTPIYVSEFNTNYAFAVDCCRNDPTYGPLWNSLAISDFLNVVYSGATAPPSRLAYFMSVGEYFCLLGQWDANMDCNDTGTITPYPQYYAFQLLASPSYLNLQAGGQMAAWVSPGSTKIGLNGTAFYTSGADNIVVVNPSSSPYNAVPVSFINPGITSATGTQYLLNSSNPQITTGSLTLSASGTTYNTTVNVPAYSTVAISLTGTISPTTPQAAPPPPPPPPVPPVPVLNVTTTSTPLTVNVDTSASQGGGGDLITGRTINFGDGTWVSSTPTTTHTYAKAGTYTVTVTLKNENNLTAATSSVIIVGAAAAPVPVLNVTPTSGTAALVVNINTSGSQGGGSSTIAGGTINFGDGSSVNSIATITHTYSNPGSYTVNLTLTNQAGLTASTSSVVTVTAPVPPVPVLNVTTTSTPLMVNVDTSASQGGGTSTITGRTINFGDGTYLSSTPTTTHTYAKVGTYTVTVTLKNENNLTAATSSVIIVGAAAAPVPVLNVTPTSGTAALVVNINTSGSQGGGSSTIAGGTINFGDGSSVNSIATTTHTYSNPGSYTVNLTLTNQAGLTASTSSVVTVTAPVPPVPVLNVTTTSTPLMVNVDTSASQGGGTSTITGRTINFGDGTYLSSTPTTTHTYAKVGTYTVTVTLKNENNLTAATSSVIIVGAATAPVPVLNVTPTSGTAALVVNINTSGSQGGGSSTIAGGTINFGDGSSVNSIATITHTYSNPGSYTVNLTLTNQAGLTATTSSVVTVTAPVPPVPVLNVTTTSTPLMVNVDTSASQGGGTSTITGRTINFGDGTYLSSTPTTTHTYAKVGTYTVTLALKNAANLTATTSSVVTVQ